MRNDGEVCRYAGRNGSEEKIIKNCLTHRGKFYTIIKQSENGCRIKMAR